MTTLASLFEPPAAQTATIFNTRAQNTPVYLGLDDMTAFAAFSAAVSGELPKDKKDEFKQRSKAQMEHHALHNIPPLGIFSGGKLAATALLTNPNHPGGVHIDDYPFHLFPDQKVFAIGHVARLQEFGHMGFPKTLLPVSEKFSQCCGADGLLAAIANTNTGSQKLFANQGYQQIKGSRFWYKSLSMKGWHHD